METHTQLSQKAREIFSRIISPVLVRHDLGHHLAGSASYDLMTWKDIDVHIRAQNDETFLKIKEATSEFMKIPGIWSVWFKDNWELIDPNAGGPRIYLGLRYCESGDIKDTWKIDCSLFPSEVYEENIKSDKKFEDSLTDESRSVILEAKHRLANPNGDMPVGVSSKIYELVQTGLSDVEAIVAKLSK